MRHILLCVLCKKGGCGCAIGQYGAIRELWYVNREAIAMRVRKALPVILLVALASVTVAASAVAESASDKIVVFKPGVSSEKVGPAIIARHGGVAGKSLRLINARAARLTPASARALARDPSVLRIDEDIIVSITGGKPKPPAQPPETLPWGIDRIDAELA
jgi:hypothetical protein